MLNWEVSLKQQVPILEEIRQMLQGTLLAGRTSRKGCASQISGERKGTGSGRRRCVAAKQVHSIKCVWTRQLLHQYCVEQESLLCKCLSGSSGSVFSGSGLFDLIDLNGSC